jgi:hypothetical protein
MTHTLTLFSAPKPFTNPHIGTIQRNAIQSWLALGPQVQVILIGEEAGLGEAAAELGALHLPQVRRNPTGTPLVSSIFELAYQASDSPLLAYINADILVQPNFLSGACQAAQLREQFLLVGQRWDLDVRTPMDFGAGWVDRLQTDLAARGRLHSRGGSDYFIYPRQCFTNVPDFAIGRAGWDNWMIYEARRQGWPCVDATETIQIIHQDHDYSHLPQGQAHYRLPETFENVRIAGGKRTIFTLIDTDYRLKNGELLRAASNPKKFWRDVETFPLIRLHSYPLAQLTYAIFHPSRAWFDLRVWLKAALTKLKRFAMNLFRLGGGRK